MTRVEFGTPEQKIVGSNPPGPKIIKSFSSSTQLKFKLLINNEVAQTHYN